MIGGPGDLRITGVSYEYIKDAIDTQHSAGLRAFIALTETFASLRADIHSTKTIRRADNLRNSEAELFFRLGFDNCQQVRQD